MKRSEIVYDLNRVLRKKYGGMTLLAFRASYGTPSVDIVSDDMFVRRECPLVLSDKLRSEVVKWLSEIGVEGDVVWNNVGTTFSVWRTHNELAYEAD